MYFRSLLITQSVAYDNFIFECFNMKYHSRRAPRFFIGQGRFSEARAQILFVFQVSSDKLRALVAILDLRGLKVYNIFNGTTMVGAVEKILKIMLSRLFQTAILE